MINTLTPELKLPDGLIRVGFSSEETDSKIYQMLVEATEELADDASLLILGEQLGGRGSTLALSLPYENLVYISGLNLPMIQSLQKTTQDVLSREIKSDELKLQLLAEHLVELGRASMICSHELLRGGGDESTVELSAHNIVSAL